MGFLKLTYEQCDHMLELKLAQFVSKVANSVIKYLRVKFFIIAQKVVNHLGFFCSKISQKSPDLVTLITNGNCKTRHSVKVWVNHFESVSSWLVR